MVLIEKFSDHSQVKTPSLKTPVSVRSFTKEWIEGVIVKTRLVVENYMF